MIKSLMCSFDNCKHQLYTIDKCILHCEKESWYEQNGKFKNWDIKQVEIFWSEFYQHIIINKNCTSFIFPEFDYYVGIDKYMEIEPIRKRNLSDIDLQNLDFTKSTFLDLFIVDNIKIINCRFRQCNFENLHIFSSEVLNCDFHASTFSDANIDGCKVTDTSFQWIYAKEISFMYSKISDSNFNNSYFEMLSLAHAVVLDTSFQNIKFTRGDIYTYRILINLLCL